MKKIGTWRAAINWYLSVYLFGSFAAILVPTLPVFCIYCVIYGFPPPAPPWLLMRLIQLTQALVISIAGGYLALRYFRNRFDVTYGQICRPMTLLATTVPVTCVMIVSLVSIPKYGVTAPLIVTSALIFGTFTVLFIAGSFHFAKGLTGRANKAVHMDADKPRQ